MNPGTGLDLDLIARARTFINAANIHSVKTWIYCYETSLPGSDRRQQFETLLREFVYSKMLSDNARRIAKRARDMSVVACRHSDWISRDIDELRRLTSD